MKSIRIKRILSVMLICIIVLCMTGCQKDKSYDVRLGTGGEGGNYYNYGLNLKKELGDEGVAVDVVTTMGSLSNLRLLSQGYLDMALVQSDIYSSADKAVTDKTHAAVGLYTECCQVVVKDKTIASIDELVNRRVSVGEKESGVAQNASDILKAYGISDKVDTVNLSFDESAKALANGEIDAFFVTASAPTPAIAELSDVHILGIDDTIINNLTGNNKAYVKASIPSGTYEGQSDEIKTVGVTALLVVSDSVSEEKEKAIVDYLKNKNDHIMDISFGQRAKKEGSSGRFEIYFNMYMTLALAVFVLLLGAYLRKKIRVLEKFCIPAPVVGGLIFALLSCVLYVTGLVEFNFDETLKNVCMIIFFTSVGFQANLKVLKKGGVGLIVFLIAIITLIVGQNLIAVGISKLLRLDPYVGLCTGSIPMVGGHGTAGAFGLVLEDLGLDGAVTLCTAAATFGLIMGSLMGGPIGRRLIIKHDLMKTIVTGDDSLLIEDEKKHHRSVSMYAPAAYQIAIAMGLGTIVSELLSKTGMTFPVYIGAMIVAAFMRNFGEYSGKFTVHMGEINDLGGICLSMFLGIAMVTLKIWQLAQLALPLVILLLAQTVFMALFSYFVVFNVMGRNYDAAILSAGTCGFGMGATPNAMANMQALTEKFAPSVQAYLLVPIVGSMFADFINSLVITFFINIL